MSGYRSLLRLYSLKMGTGIFFFGILALGKRYPSPFSGRESCDADSGT